MKNRLLIFPLVSVAIILFQPFNSHGQKKDSLAINSQFTTVKKDGQHDFDFEIGTWKTTLKRLNKPLTGSTTWIEYTGITTVKKIWNGLANLVKLEITGTDGPIKVLSLRLYDPQSHQWSLNFANANGGGIAIPTKTANSFSLQKQ